MASDLPVLDYADQNADRLVPITTYNNELLVHMAASKLEAEGIRTVIEDHPRRAGAVRPARIKVFADDVPAAVAILRQTPARDYLLEEEIADEKKPTLEYSTPQPQRNWWHTPRVERVHLLVNLAMILLVAGLVVVGCYVI